MSARYLLRGLIGVVLAAASVVIASVTIYHLVRTGSCASGGPYVSARPCPSGTGLRIVALVGSIFVLAPVSVFVFGSRAKGMAGVPTVGGLIGLLWTMGWIGMGTAAWVAGHGPAKPVSGGEGSTAVAITFWGIGGVSLLFVILGLGAGGMAARARARASDAGAGPRPTPPPPPRPTPAPAPVPRPAPVAAGEADDVARRLKQLDELRALGAVTDAEYAAKRREILGEI